MKAIGARSARSVTMIVTGVQVLSKVAGYGRTILIASLFGLSAEMDSFNIALGIAVLCPGVVANTLESVVLPILIKARIHYGSEAARHFMACVWWILFAISLIFSCAVLLEPEGIIRFFAGGFDEERIRIGSRMLVWLLPYGVVTMLQAAWGIWALSTERYALSGIAAGSFNLVAIPVLLLLVVPLGGYAVGAANSVAAVAGMMLFLFFVRDFPVRIGNGRLPLELLVHAGRNVVLVLLLGGASALWIVVDRYFASMLPIGSVTAISYSLLVFGAVISLVSPALLVYLAKSSEVAARDEVATVKTAIDALCIAFCYCFPLGLVLVVAAKPIISLCFGWGLFDENAVSLTGACLAAYAAAFPFCVASNIFYRLAQSRGDLGRVVFLSYILVGVNAGLDWFLSRLLGAPGLAWATSIVQVLAVGGYVWLLLPESFSAFREWKIGQQMMLGVLWVVPEVVFLKFSSFSAFVYAVVCCLVHFFLAERFCLFEALPKGWKPSEMARYALDFLVKT
jgi:peptidoglycan biosynthesis protein MviN/MurJ (putative lipid II flippase)